MIIYGKIQHGQRVVVVKGLGFSFSIYNKAGAIKNETTLAGGACETHVNLYTQHTNTQNAGVKHKFDARA